MKISNHNSTWIEHFRRIEGQDYGKLLWNIRKKAENWDIVRPFKGLLDCYIETGTEHQMLRLCNDDDVDDFDAQVTVHRDKFL